MNANVADVSVYRFFCCLQVANKSINTIERIERSWNNLNSLNYNSLKVDHSVALETD